MLTKYQSISLYSKVLEPPTSLDYSTGTCQSTIRNQLCNSCSAHAATAALEYCLCLAGDENISARLIEKTCKVSEETKFMLSGPFSNCQSALMD